MTQVSAHVDGRYPSVAKHIDPKTMQVFVVEGVNYVVFRVDDSVNTEFWMEITITKRQLQDVLGRTESPLTEIPGL
jgi:hypothetical protein